MGRLCARLGLPLEFLFVPQRSIMWRKGERKVEKTGPPYDEKHPVAQMIATGSGWFWSRMAQTTPLVVLEKRSGIDFGRLLGIDLYDLVTCAELEVLARAWNAPLEDVIASIPNPEWIVDRPDARREV